MAVRLALFIFLILETASLLFAQPREISTKRQPCASAECAADAMPSLPIHDAAAPKDAVAEFQKGFKEELRNRPDQAEKHFRKAVKIYPQFDAAIAGLGQALSNQDRWDEAERLVIPALENAPQHPALLRLRASVYQHAKRYVESIPLLRRALTLDPHSEAGHVLLARAEFMTGDCKNAQVHAQQAHGEWPHINALPHLISAQCHEKDGNLADARREYENYLKASPDDQGAAFVRSHLEKLQASSPAER